MTILASTTGLANRLSVSIRLARLLLASSIESVIFLILHDIRIHITNRTMPKTRNIAKKTAKIITSI